MSDDRSKEAVEASETQLLLVKLRARFRREKSVIQRINTGDMPVSEAAEKHKDLIRDMAQYLAVTNSLKISRRLHRLDKGGA